MARNKSGGFNKLLNFIGLVDDEDTQDTYGEEPKNTRITDSRTKKVVWQS